MLKPENLHSRPEPVEYELRPIKFRHYGKILEELIDIAADMPEGEERTQLVMLLAHHMKKMMLAVNKDGVDDDKIFKDLAYYSKGKILLDSSTCQLRDFKELTQQPAANAKKSKKRK